METIILLSRNTNWGFNTNDNELFLNSASQLYNYVQQNGSNSLMKIEDGGQLQTIGMAFYYSAHFIDYNDLDLNSVAAENAFFCLAKSVTKGNYFAAPKLYNLLNSKPELLLSKYTSALRLFERKGKGLSNMYYNSLQFLDKNKMINQLVACTRFYIITKFYCVETNKFLISEDIIDCPIKEVEAEIENMRENSFYNDARELGEVFFEELYNEILKTISFF